MRFMRFRQLAVKCVLLFVGGLVIGALSCKAQSTTVSITTVDASGTVWANGTISYTFQGNGSYQGPYQWNGANLPNNYLTATVVNLNSSGAASWTIPTASAISPGGTSWLYQICPNASAPCQQFTIPSIGSTQNISSTVTASLASPKVSAGVVTRAYADAEVATIPSVGGTYYNTTPASCGPKYWNGATWVCSNIGGSTTSQSWLQTIADNLITYNSEPFIGSPFGAGFQAAPNYGPYMFIADFTLTYEANPSAVADSTVVNVLNNFLANVNGSGEIPIAVGNFLNAFLYYSGWDQAHLHATPDGAFEAPVLELGHYNSSGSITQFNGDAAKLAAALNALTIDSTTGCPYITPNSERSMFGFHDLIRATGADSLDCVLYARATKIMAQLYGIAGNPTQQGIWTTKSNAAINNGLSTSSALWDATDGMLYTATIQNNTNINIPASVLALKYGFLSTGQAAAVKNWVVTNFSSSTYEGYIRNSPTDFAILGTIPNTGGPPYTCSYEYNTSPSCAQGVYDDGYWTWFYAAYVEALEAAGRSDLAQSLVNANLATPDPTVEYISQSGKYPNVGQSYNTESPQGPLAVLNEFPSLNMAQPSNPYIILVILIAFQVFLVHYSLLRLQERLVLQYGVWVLAVLACKLMLVLVPQ